MHVRKESGQSHILIVDDEENMRHMLARLLAGKGYRVQTAADGQQALECIQQKDYDFVLCDIKMPRMDGMAFLEAARAHLGKAVVIMMSAYGTVDIAIQAIQKGAYDYIAKPFKADEVLLVLGKAQERENLRSENRRLKERIRTMEGDLSFGHMIANSAPMENVFKLARKAANYDTTVLITGESGTGKELVAKGIHVEGHRQKGPLVAVNCGGIPENLLESELFGYKKGAFTGAYRDKTGLIPSAHGGTLFLDEIGELPLGLQVKLLRVLQEREVLPVGGSLPQSIDVRIIAATARDLQEDVGQGLFREDLFYRLNVLSIRLPALRERGEDIPLLCEHFVARFNRRLNRNISGVSTDAMAQLMDYPWPGNVRELENIIERAVVMAEDGPIGRKDLPDGFGATHLKKGGWMDYHGDSLKKAQRILEKEMITRVLKKTGGNRTQAGRLLEISHPSLLSKIKAYQIEE